jgi:hypothetical protein
MIAPLMQGNAHGLWAGADRRPYSVLRSAYLLLMIVMLAFAGRAQTTISTLPAWDGAQAAYPLGVPASVGPDVYGQVFTAPSSASVLTDFKINVAWNYGLGVTLTGYLAPWDGIGRVGARSIAARLRLLTPAPSALRSLISPFQVLR